MDALFGAVGFVLFLVGIGIVVINLFKKDAVKRKKGRNILILGFVLFCVGITMDPTETTKPAETAKEEKPAVVEPVAKKEVEQVVEVEEPLVEVEPVEVEVEEPQIDEKELEKAMGQLAYQLMKNNFDGIADIDYREGDKVFNIIPTDNDLVLAVTLFATGNVDLSAEWNDMVENFRFMSESMSENIGPGYIINLINPANTEKTLLTIVDGVIVYNVSNEI